MKTAYLKYVSSLLLFASNGIVASYIALNSYEIVLSRAFIGGLFLIGLFILLRKPLQAPKHKKDFFFLVISGTATGASWLFLYEAYVQIGVSMATLAYYCGPVIVMALAPFIFHEKLTKFKLFGFMIVLIGMLLVNFQELHAGFSWGLLCGILSAFMYAAMVIFNKKSVNITGLENAMWQLIISFIVVGIFTFIQQGVRIDIPTGSILPILILGLVNTGIGCYLYFSSFSQLPAQSVAICGYLDPVAALVFSAIFLHEHLTGMQLIGTVFILGGAAFGELIKQKSSPPS